VGRPCPASTAGPAIRPAAAATDVGRTRPAGFSRGTGDVGCAHSAGPATRRTAAGPTAAGAAPARASRGTTPGGPVAVDVNPAGDARRAARPTSAFRLMAARAARS
jgi:hypothetical protein